MVDHESTTSISIAVYKNLSSKHEAPDITCIQQ